VELIISGQGYVTPKQLMLELRDELMVAGGRIAISTLHEILNVDLTTIQEKVEEMCVERPGQLVEEQGELIADYYLDDVATEINGELQEAGQLTIGDLATRYNFSASFLGTHMTQRLGRLIDGRMER
jgi:hypothetical protein